MGHFLWAPALGAFLQTLSVKPSTKQLDVAKCPNTIWAIFLSFLPIAYGMGSNNSILITTAFTAYFLLLAFFTILRRYLNPREWFFKIAGLSILSLILSLGFLYVILANPYRQPYNLWENDFPFSPQKGTKEVYLNRFVGGYLSALRQLTEDNGFKQGGAFIDLTGRLPGTQLIVGGLTKGTSWILSGYRNSQASFRFALQKIPCEDLAKTWLLLWNTTAITNHLDPKALLESGMALDKDFEFVGGVKFPVSISKTTATFSGHIIFKPKTDYTTLLNSCHNARNHKINDYVQK